LASGETEPASLWMEPAVPASEAALWPPTSETVGDAASDGDLETVDALSGPALDVTL